jgi:O-methyltransferase
MRNAATSSIIIYQLARQALRLPGEVAEVGVYKGGSAYLMDAIFDPDIPIHLFDTFAGMPPVDPENR